MFLIHVVNSNLTFPSYQLQRPIRRDIKRLVRCLGWSTRNNSLECWYQIILLSRTTYRRTEVPQIPSVSIIHLDLCIHSSAASKVGELGWCWVWNRCRSLDVGRGTLLDTTIRRYFQGCHETDGTHVVPSLGMCCWCLYIPRSFPLDKQRLLCMLARVFVYIKTWCD